MNNYPVMLDIISETHDVRIPFFLTKQYNYMGVSLNGGTPISHPKIRYL